MKTIEEVYVKQIYNEIADQFNNTRVYTWSWIRNFINKVPKNGFIYDIGCGNGRNMISQNHTMIGIDNCEKFIEMCRNKNKLVILNEITNISLPDNSADAIICIAVIHHLSTNELRLKALLEIKRLIKFFKEKYL